MSRTTELLCAHGALVFVALMAAGLFGITGWLPVVDPGLDADAVAALFEDNRMRIRIGLSLTALGSVFWWPYSAALAMQMKRIEGDHHPLTYVQMAASAGTALPVLFSCYIWLTIAYRAEIPAGTLQALNDYAWLTFVGIYPPGLLQNLSLGICILTDKSDDASKPYPRWVGYASIWLGLLFLPGALLPFFQDGPFAWNGILGFWLVATAFFLWILTMWWMTVRAINKKAA